jgi:serine/threonine protein kinase
MENILKIYGISQNPNTNDYIMVLEYAEGGTFNNYLVKNHESFDWLKGLSALANIINGLNEIHQNHIVHRNFHIGNILFTKMDPDDKDYINYNYNHINDRYEACISDIGLFRKIGDTDKTNIYGVMPYVAPEVLKGKPYTRAADIYSFGMIMYVVATGKQPFANCAHDKSLILNIYSGVRPELNEKIAPKCYIDLMKKCWNLDPDNRPGSVEIKELIYLFYSLLNGSCRTAHHYEIRKQFEQSQEHRKENLLMIESNQLTTHTQAIYTSRLLNPFTSK